MNFKYKVFLRMLAINICHAKVFIIAVSCFIGACSSNLSAAEPVGGTANINSDNRKEDRIVNVQVSDLKYHSPDSVGVCEKYVSLISNAVRESFCMRSFKGYERLQNIDWIELSSDEAIDIIKYLEQKNPLKHIKDQEKLNQVRNNNVIKTIENYKEQKLLLFSAYIDLDRDGKSEKVIRRLNKLDYVENCFDNYSNGPDTYYFDDRPTGYMINQGMDLLLDSGSLIKIDNQYIVDKWHKSYNDSDVGEVSLTELVPNPSKSLVNEITINRNICQFKVKFK